MSPGPVERCEKSVRGEYDSAFVLKALLVEEIWEVARRREGVTPKSTYIYPKIKSGIILCSLWFTLNSVRL